MEPIRLTFSSVGFKQFRLMSCEARIVANSVEKRHTNSFEPSAGVD
jgi:hypothetical protein